MIQPYVLNGMEIDELGMMRIVEHYKEQRTKEYLEEKYDISEECALNMSRKLHIIHGKEDDDFEERISTELFDVLTSSLKQCTDKERGNVILCGNLAIVDRGIDGLAVFYFTEEGNKPREVLILSADDMLDYTYDELVPENFIKRLTEQQKSTLIHSYLKAMTVVKHRDYYDATDNTWKDYD